MKSNDPLASGYYNNMTYYYLTLQKITYHYLGILYTFVILSKFGILSTFGILATLGILATFGIFHTLLFYTFV